MGARWRGARPRAPERARPRERPRSASSTLGGRARRSSSRMKTPVLGKVEQVLLGFDVIVHICIDDVASKRPVSDLLRIGAVRGTRRGQDQPGRSRLHRAGRRCSADSRRTASSDVRSRRRRGVEETSNRDDGLGPRGRRALAVRRRASARAVHPSLGHSGLPHHAQRSLGGDERGEGRGRHHLDEIALGAIDHAAPLHEADDLRVVHVIRIVRQPERLP